MAADNQTTIAGNLVEDPELRFTNTGTPVTNVRVAVTQRIQQDGEWRDGDTSFFKVNVWRGQAEHLADSLSKGDRVMVTGRLRQRSWETPQGEKRSVAEIEADEVGASLKFATAKVERTHERATSDRAQGQERQAERGSDFNEPPPFWVEGRDAGDQVRTPARRPDRLPGPRRRATRPGVDPWSFGHLDIAWEDPGISLFCRTLASFCRLIVFDRRGTGLSDPLPPDPLPPWEAYAQELAVVLDVVGAERAALLSEIDAGPTAILFAATQPDRVSALILSHTTARFVAADDYPIGIPPEVAEALLAQMDQLWGSETMAAMLAPSRAGDERFRRWFGKMVRAGASPRAAQRILRAMMEVDVRPALPLIQAPTLVLHRRDTQLIPVEHGRYLAEHIPRARLVELAGADATIFWETTEVALDQVEAFLAGVRRIAAPTRVLATVLFTDIVGSTQQANRLGDRRWRELLEVHDEVARRLVEEFGGQLIKTTGDGILATFDGPGRAIRCAAALRDELGGIGVQIRAGLHTGEVELRDGDVGGIAVHIAARVLAAAQPGDILASRTVRDLVVGSDITLVDHGTQPLKGVEGTWQLFSAMPP